MPIYNKLVRDLIPQFIEVQGKSLNTEILADQAYQRELKLKLQEEVDEYLEAVSGENAIEELADVLEIIYTLAKQHGASTQDLEKVRKEKSEKHGAFNDKVFLIRVDD